MIAFQVAVRLETTLYQGLERLELKITQQVKEEENSVLLSAAGNSERISRIIIGEWAEQFDKWVLGNTNLKTTPE
jgi:hypothetical protein